MSMLNGWSDAPTGRRERSYRGWAAMLGLALGVSTTPAMLAAAPGAGRVFRAGAATSNITPPLGVPLVGSTNVVGAAHVHDELHARCLALDDGARRLVFVVVDNLSVNREVFDEAKRRIHEATGVPPENMMMSATHTHSAANARGVNPLLHTKELDPYQAFLAQRIADGVRRAINQLEPARIAWGAGQLPQHVFNRRWVLKDGKTVVNPFGGQDRAIMNPGRRPDLDKPAGPTNPEVYVLSVQSAAGRPLAVLTNYWLHYVGGVPGDHASADYFGAFCDRLQQLLGADRQDPPFVGLLANGPCGDVNNSNLHAPPSPREPPYARIRAVANDLAQEVVRVYSRLEYRDWVELQAAQTELELGVRRPSAADVERARAALARPATVSPIHGRELTYARRTIDALQWPATVKIILQAFRVGELAVAAIPFEVFTETGLEIKARSPFKDTFTIELANGGYAYLPTPEQHELGGYETWLGTNRVEKEATRKIVPQVLGLLAQLRAVAPATAAAPSPPAGVRASATAVQAWELLWRTMGERDAGWSRVHAAEALSHLGHAAQVGQPLTAELPTWENSPQRIGAWRVLAAGAASPAERRGWLERIEGVARDPAAADRLQAVESLGKLGEGVTGTTLAAVRAHAAAIPAADALFPFWVLHLSGDSAGTRGLLTGLGATDPAVRRRAAFIVRRLSPLAAEIKAALTQLARTEPATTVAYPYVLAAALAHDVGPVRPEVSWTELERVWAAAPGPVRLELSQVLMPRQTRATADGLAIHFTAAEPGTRIAAAWSFLYALGAGR